MPSTNLSIATFIELTRRGQKTSPYLIPACVLLLVLYPNVVFLLLICGLIYLVKSKKTIRTRAQRKKTIPKSIKDAVWNKWIGIRVGQIVCPMCSNYLISQSSFHCGHVIAESMGGLTNFENLRPICPTCNLSMGSQNLFDYAKKCFPGARILQFR